MSLLDCGSDGIAAPEIAGLFKSIVVVQDQKKEDGGDSSTTRQVEKKRYRIDRNSRKT